MVKKPKNFRDGRARGARGRTDVLEITTRLDKGVECLRILLAECDRLRVVHLSDLVAPELPQSGH